MLEDLLRQQPLDAGHGEGLPRARLAVGEERGPAGGGQGPGHQRRGHGAVDVVGAAVLIEDVVEFKPHTRENSKAKKRKDSGQK